MKQKAKMFIVGTVREYIHVMGVANDLHPVKAVGWWTEFLGPATSAEQDRGWHP